MAMFYYLFSEQRDRFYRLSLILDEKFFFDISEAEIFICDWRLTGVSTEVFQNSKEFSQDNRLFSMEICYKIFSGSPNFPNPWRLLWTSPKHFHCFVTQTFPFKFRVFKPLLTIFQSSRMMIKAVAKDILLRNEKLFL